MSAARWPLAVNPRRAFLGLLLALGWWLVLGAAGPVPALAQQGGQEFDQVTVGPYRLTVVGGASALSLGSARYTVTVQDAATGQPVPDANVVIRTRHEEKGAEGWANAVKMDNTPGLYEAQMKLDLPGTWTVSVRVSSPLGQVETQVTSLVIPQARQYLSGSLVFAGVSLALASILAYLVWSVRRAQRKQRVSRASHEG